MTDMKHVDFAANGAHVEGVAENSLMLSVTGSIGGGELQIQRFSASRNNYVTVAIYTAPTTAAEEIKLGKGAKIRFQLSDATAPALAIDYWFV